MDAGAMPNVGMPEQEETPVATSRPLPAVNHRPSGPGRSHYRPISADVAIAPDVSVVIPVKNEARNLPTVLGSLPSWVNEVVLVDGRSVDNTVAVARQCRRSEEHTSALQ